VRASTPRSPPTCSGLMYWGVPSERARSREAIHPGALERQRDTEVRHHRLSFVQQNVLGLDVAVDDPVAVRMVQGACHLGRDPDRFAHGELLLALELLAEGLAFHEGHHVVEEPVRRSRVEEWQKVRVLEPGGNANLREEPVSPRTAQSSGRRTFTATLRRCLRSSA